MLLDTFEALDYGVATGGVTDQEVTVGDPGDELQRRPRPATTELREIRREGEGEGVQENGELTLGACVCSV